MNKLRESIGWQVFVLLTNCSVIYWLLVCHWEFQERNAKIRLLQDQIRMIQDGVLEDLLKRPPEEFVDELPPLSEREFREAQEILRQALLRQGSAPQ